MAKDGWGLGNMLLGALFRRGSMKPLDMDADYRINPKKRPLRALTPGLELLERQPWKPPRDVPHDRDRHHVAEDRACPKIRKRAEGVSASRTLPTVGLVSTRAHAADVGGQSHSEHQRNSKHNSGGQDHRRQLRPLVDDLRPKDPAVRKAPSEDSIGSRRNHGHEVGVLVPHSSNDAAAQMDGFNARDSEVACRGELWLSGGMGGSEELALVPAVYTEGAQDAGLGAEPGSHSLALEDESLSRDIKEDASLSLQLAEYAASCGADISSSILDQPELWVGLLHDEVIGPELCTVLKKEVRQMVTRRGGGAGALAANGEQSKDQACQANGEDIQSTPPDKVVTRGGLRNREIVEVDRTPAPHGDKWRFERVDLSQKCAQEHPVKATPEEHLDGKADLLTLTCKDSCESVVGNFTETSPCQHCNDAPVDEAPGPGNTAVEDDDARCVASVEEEDVDADDDSDAAMAVFVPTFAKVMQYLQLSEKIGLAKLCQTSAEVLCEATVWDPVLINIVELGQLDSALAAGGVGPCARASSMSECRRDQQEEDPGIIDKDVVLLRGLLRASHLRVDLSPRIPGAWTYGSSADPLGLLCQRILPKFRHLEYLELINVEDVSMDFRFLNLRSTVFREFGEVVLNPSRGIFGDGTRMYSLVASKATRSAGLDLARIAGRAAGDLFMSEHRAAVRRGGGEDFHIAHAPWRCFQGSQVRTAYERVFPGALSA